MRDEAKTWWLSFGPNVASSYFFLKKIRVALESRTLISVPLLQTMTLNLLVPSVMLKVIAQTGRQANDAKNKLTLHFVKFNLLRKV